MKRAMLALMVLTIPLYSALSYCLHCLGWNPVTFAMAGPGVGIPNTYNEGWVVLPGALLLGAALQPLLRARRQKTLWGALLGALLSPLNVVISTFIALTYWHFSSPHYYYEGLLELWLQTILFTVWRCLPLAIPCGALLGALVGAILQHHSQATSTSSSVSPTG